MFWMWRHNGLALWRHEDGAWHNVFFLTTASNDNSWAGIAPAYSHNWIWELLIIEIKTAIGISMT